MSIAITVLLALVLSSLLSQCQESLSACFNGEIRLNNRASMINNGHQGVVELCHDEIWRPVCFSNVNPHEASIICTQQGYYRYGAEIQESLVDCGLNGIDLLCTRGTESTVEECVYNPLPYSCPNAIVTCSKANCTNFELRLVGGATPWEGRVEVCVDGRWGTVCSEGWTGEDAGHVCTRLGYPTQDAVITKTTGKGNGPTYTLSSLPSQPDATCHDYLLTTMSTSNCTHSGLICDNHTIIEDIEDVIITTHAATSTEQKLTTAKITEKNNDANKIMPTLCGSGITEHSFILSLLGLGMLNSLTTVALVTVIIGWIITCVYYQQKMKTQLTKHTPSQPPTQTSHPHTNYIDKIPAPPPGSCDLTSNEAYDSVVQCV